MKALALGSFIALATWLVIIAAFYFNDRHG